MIALPLFVFRPAFRGRPKHKKRKGWFVGWPTRGGGRPALASTFAEASAFAKVTADRSVDRSLRHGKSAALPPGRYALALSARQIKRTEVHCQEHPGLAARDEIEPPNTSGAILPSLTSFPSR